MKVYAPQNPETFNFFKNKYFRKNKQSVAFYSLNLMACYFEVYFKISVLKPSLDI